MPEGGDEESLSNLPLIGGVEPSLSSLPSAWSYCSRPLESIAIEVGSAWGRRLKLTETSLESIRRMELQRPDHPIP